MYLVDTNIVSEARKGARADPGVRRFFRQVESQRAAVWLSAVTVGELRCGVERIRRRGDAAQAGRLEAWLDGVLERYADRVLPFDADAAQVWGYLRASDPGGELDKQIAAIALVNDLTVVTRNVGDFDGTGVRVLDPFDTAGRGPAPAASNP